MLRQTAEFKGAEVVRTRDPEVLKTLDAVVDVGGVYGAYLQGDFALTASHGRPVHAPL